MYFKHKLANIFYEKKGDSSCSMIILPGWGNTRKTFQFIMDYFSPYYTIYIFDYPGFGNSPPPQQILTMDDYALIIKDFILQNKITNPIIISHSFGGRILAILSGRYKIPMPKIVLFDVAGIKRINLLLIFKTFIYKIIKKVCSIFHCSSLLQKVRYYFSSNDYQSLSPSMMKTFQNIIHKDLRNDYKKIRSDVLIIWGKKDSDTPVKDAYYLYRNIPNSGLIIYTNAEHFSYLDEPIKTLQILNSFFKEKDKD